jgi:HD superfamily phosphodiesterase
MVTKMDKEQLCKDLINDMKAVFGDDKKRIDHALNVLVYAQKLQASEGGDGSIIDASAILHDIGIHQAERKYGSAAGKYQEIEGPPIAEKILRKYDFDDRAIEFICDIIANHHSGKCQESTEFSCVWDADKIVNILEELNIMSRKNLKTFISNVFKTKSGKNAAEELFL